MTIAGGEYLISATAAGVAPIFAKSSLIYNPVIYVLLNTQVSFFKEDRKFVSSVGDSRNSRRTKSNVDHSTLQMRAAFISLITCGRITPQTGTIGGKIGPAFGAKDLHTGAASENRSEMSAKVARNLSSKHEESSMPPPLPVVYSPRIRITSKS